MHRLTPRFALLLVPAVLLTLTLSACGKDGGAAVGKGGDAKTTATGAAPATTTSTTPADTGPRKNAGGCEATIAPRPKGEQDIVKPRLRLDSKRTYIATMQTSCGTVRIRLAVKDFPKTTASFVALTRLKFYDGLIFHRISRPGGSPFVIQGGDPLGTGDGGPGYSVVEDPPSDQKYKRGTVAMAKTEIEDPGTSGSQFFIVTAPDAGLPADYAVLGTVVGGQPAVDRIGNVPSDPSTEMPTEPVVIRSISVEASGAKKKN